MSLWVILSYYFHDQDVKLQWHVPILHYTKKLLTTGKTAERNKEQEKQY